MDGFLGVLGSWKPQFPTKKVGMETPRGAWGITKMMGGWTCMVKQKDGKLDRWFEDDELNMFELKMTSKMSKTLFVKSDLLNTRRLLNMIRLVDNKCQWGYPTSIHFLSIAHWCLLSGDWTHSESLDWNLPHFLSSERVGVDRIHWPLHNPLCTTPLRLSNISAVAN